MRSAAVTAVVALVLIAGCGGGGSEGPVQLTAAPAMIDTTALSETGYEPDETETRWINTTVSVSLSGDVELQASKAVRARSQVTTYERKTAAGPAAVAVLSVPSVHLLESSADIVRNPANDDGLGDLADGLLDDYTDVEVVEQRDNTSVRMLGNDTFLVEYAATATHDGGSIEVRLFSATTRHGGDFVTLVAIVPASAADPARIRQLLSGLDHDGTAPGGSG